MSSEKKIICKHKKKFSVSMYKMISVISRRPQTPCSIPWACALRTQVYSMHNQMKAFFKHMSTHKHIERQRGYGDTERKTEAHTLDLGGVSFCWPHTHGNDSISSSMWHHWWASSPHASLAKVADAWSWLLQQSRTPTIIILWTEWLVQKWNGNPGKLRGL